MFPRVYRNSQFGAPALTGNAQGTLIGVYDACLLNGTSWQAATITSAGGTATMTTSSAHGLERGDVFQVSGANESEYNGIFRAITAVGTTVTYAIAGSPASPATGTIQTRVPPAGWTAPFSGTNKKVYRNAYNTAYWQIDDNAYNSQTTTRMARVWMYETMTAIDTGTGGTSPSGQNLPCSVSKATGADATSRPWCVIATDRACWLLIDWESNSRWTPYFFGDFPSFKPGDIYRSLVLGGNNPGQSSTGMAHNNGDTNVIARLYPVGGCNDMVTNVDPRMRALRDSSGHSVQSVACAMAYLAPSAAANMNGTSGFGGNLAFPNVADGNVFVGRIYIVETQALPISLRGIMPGIYFSPCLITGLPASRRGVIPGVDVYGQTRDLMAFAARYSGLADNFLMLFDFTVAWE